MDLKERLLLHNLKKKYENQYGIKSFRICPLDELTENEKNVLRELNKTGSQCTDSLSLHISYSEQMEWVKQKVKPYLNNDSEIVIFDSGHLIILLLEDAEIFLDRYLDDKRQTLSICIINRNTKKCVKTFLGEYDLEYFERDI